MKERGIIFNGAMVRAILEGKKTQTRRAITEKTLHLFDVAAKVGECHELTSGEPADERSQPYYQQFCPFGQPGDRLWVRETFGYVSPDEHERPHSECNIEYRADLPPGCTDRPGNWPAAECAGDPARPRWRPSIHMPRKAARIILEITDVRVERLNGISEDDCRKEGCQGGHGAIPGYQYSATPREQFSHLWQSIYGQESWDSNPWVWVVEFKQVSAVAGKGSV